MSSFIKKNKKPTTTIVEEEKPVTKVPAEKKSKKASEPATAIVAAANEVERDEDQVITNSEEDQQTKELIEKHVNQLIVRDALRALIKYEKEKAEGHQQGNQKRSLFDEQPVKSILLQMEFTRYNTTFKNIKPIRVKIPHSFHQLNENTSDYEFNICLIVKSNQKQFISNYFENYSPNEEILQYITKNSLIPINYSKNITIYSINDIKLYFKEYKQRRELLNNFTHFFVDHEISLYVYNLLGKTFQEHNKYPVPIYYSKNLSNVSSTLEQQKELALTNTKKDKTNNAQLVEALNEDRIHYNKLIKELHKHIYESTYLYLHNKNIQFKIGYSNMNISQIESNILSGLFYIMKMKLSNQWKSIKCIYLRTKDSPALPIYSHINFELYEYLQQKIAEKKEQLTPSSSQAVEGNKKKGKAVAALPAPSSVTAVSEKAKKVIAEAPVAPVVSEEAGAKKGKKSDKKRKHVEEQEEEKVEEPMQIEEKEEEVVQTKTDGKKKKRKN